MEIVSKICTCGATFLHWVASSSWHYLLSRQRFAFVLRRENRFFLAGKSGSHGGNPELTAFLTEVNAAFCAVGASAGLRLASVQEKVVFRLCNGLEISGQCRQCRKKWVIVIPYSFMMSLCTESTWNTVSTLRLWYAEK